MNPEAQNFKLLGNHAYKKKDFHTALTNYGKAIELEPTEITYYLNIAAVHLESKNYTECISTCNKAIEVGRENRADFKLIAKGLVRMGTAYRRSGDLKNAKMAYEKAVTEQSTPDYRKYLSEIEKELKKAMEGCQIKSTTAKTLYKVVEIKGKGMGCIALEDIEIGTLILKEKCRKPKIEYKDFKSGLHSYDDYLCSLLDLFFSMNKDDQDEYLMLHNGFLHPDSLSDLRKEDYVYWARFAQFHEEKWISKSNARFHVDRHFILKIICIRNTNTFDDYLFIKCSRFNHSCSPNSESRASEVCYGTYNYEEIQIRATSKIKKGEEICITYFDDLAMKNRKERQDRLQKEWNFICSCERCQDEEINNDDETYEKFQKLQEEAQKYTKKANFNHSSEYIDKAISCHKEMYNLAENKKAPKIFIIYQILIKWYDLEIDRYNNTMEEQLSFHGSTPHANGSRRMELFGKMEYFKGEREKLAKLILQMVKIVSGEDSPSARFWKEKCDEIQNLWNF